MKLIYFCVLLVLYCGQIYGLKFGRVRAPQVDSVAGVQTLWFQQILDHFESDNVTYWNQRYFVNEAAWNNTVSNFPVFLLIGGEGAASANWMTGGAWVDWAYNHGALLFQLEHRYYGESHPTPDTSTENLKYLSSEQAIQDISYFISQINHQYNLTSDNKWVLFGGSYPGNLVAWARLLLQNQVYAGVSSSGPLMAELDFYQYMDVVRTSLDTISPGCSSAIPTAVKSIQNQFKTSNGVKAIMKKFNVCAGFSTFFLYDTTSFYEAISSPITSAVQYNGQSFGSDNINYVCNKFLNNQSISDPVDRLAALNKATSKGCLYASYSGDVAYYQSTNWNDSANSGGNRQWIYQTCNEFGYYQTSERTSSLFRNTISLDYSLQQCQDIFGFEDSEVKDNVQYTNSYYHGTNINVTRVVFVQGSIDPWHALGLVNHPTRSSPQIYIKGASHCQDMLSPSAFDSPAMINARSIISRYINQWLS